MKLVKARVTEFRSVNDSTEFEIGDILSLDPSLLWNKTKKYSGMDKKRYDEYFHGKECGHAIEIAKVKRYRRAKKLTDSFVAKVDEMLATKEAELMEV